MKDKRLTFIDLFAGIGGFHLGMERAGFDCVWSSEIDPYCRRVYSLNFNVMPYGDIRTINFEKDKFVDFDILCGGFPCQAFSVAGKRRGFDDTRGTLFFEIARILENKHPRLFLLENVKGLLSHDGGRTFKTIISTLTELGYNLQWQVLNSKDFGVPQNRERVFIIGSLRTIRQPKIFPLARNEEADFREIKNEAINCIDANYYKGIDNHGQRTVIRQPLRFLERNQKNIEGDYSYTVDTSNTGGIRIGDDIRRLTPLECERLQGFPDDWTDKEISDTQRYKMLGNAVTVNVVEYLGVLLHKEILDYGL